MKTNSVVTVGSLWVDSRSGTMLIILKKKPHHTYVGYNSVVVYASASPYMTGIITLYEHAIRDHHYNKIDI